ncbi:MAG: ArsR family transcriptional regulator [Alphaproteobacteria bacterium]|nr:MAG: ArsR family transcriptional regulator [Alphaproteobacteria bacterium]
MDCFAALADPTRLRIVEMLAIRGQLPASAIARRFAVSAPAISQHLKILRAARLVRVQARAQQRLYSLDGAGFDALDQWLRRMRLLHRARN